MHELSLSESILRTALEAARPLGGSIRALTLKVGAVSSVSVSTLEFCMGLVLECNGLEGVEVRVEHVAARVSCACGRQYSTEDLFEPCPHCGGYDREIIEGRDVMLESIEVENGKDQSQPAGTGPEPGHG